jgi:hypothetical protein
MEDISIILTYINGNTMDTDYLLFGVNLNEIQTRKNSLLFLV